MNQLALRPAREVQVAHEHVAWIEAADVVFSVARFTIALLAPVLVPVADILVTVADGGRTMAAPERQPLVLAIVNPVISFA